MTSHVSSAIFHAAGRFAGPGRRAGGAVAIGNSSSVVVICSSTMMSSVALMIPFVRYGYFTSCNPFSTPNTPVTSRARISAIRRSAALSTTPSSVVRPFFTMM